MQNLNPSNLGGSQDGQPLGDEPDSEAQQSDLDDVSDNLSQESMTLSRKSRLAIEPAANQAVAEEDLGHNEPRRGFTVAEVTAYEDAIAIIGCCMAVCQVYFMTMLLRCPYSLY